LQVLARRFALGGVQPAVAVLVELFHQLRLLLRPAEAAGPAAKTASAERWTVWPAVLPGRRGTFLELRAHE
jgi:hypothetical protein